MILTGQRKRWKKKGELVKHSHGGEKGRKGGGSWGMESVDVGQSIFGDRGTKRGIGKGGGKGGGGGEKGVMAFQVRKRGRSYSKKEEEKKFVASLFEGMFGASPNW